jgi:hypothetical protein
MTTTAGRLLWRRSDAVSLLAADAVAVILLAVAWWGTSRAVTASRQDGWFSLGMAGLVVAGMAHGLWLLAGRSAVSRRARALAFADLAVQAGRFVDSRTPAVLVGDATLAHYHRSGCRLAAGRPVTVAERGAHERLGRRPCGVCRP